ncbi:MAG: hypothetical protein IPP49_21190 [Saprospiraceae bacterium]|nr:hypothetical protein [Saprospiraceae bacterium]
MPNKCPGENFAATASGFNATSPYTQTYFLTNTAGQILAGQLDRKFHSTGILWHLYCI